MSKRTVLADIYSVVLADVAEWLRRLTRNQFPSWSVGSNPTICVMISLFFQFNRDLFAAIVKNSTIFNQKEPLPS